MFVAEFLVKKMYIQNTAKHCRQCNNFSHEFKKFWPYSDWKNL